VRGNRRSIRRVAGKRKRHKKRRLNIDRLIGISALVVSTLVAIAVTYFTLLADRQSQERQEVFAGSQSEASFVQACLDYEAFVIEQYRAGLTEEQIYDLAPVGLLVLQTGYYQTAQSCPSVDEIILVLDSANPSE
jgi:hypothetical protein